MTKVDIDLARAARDELCRRDFWRFRNRIHRNLIDGWWQREVAQKLQEFRQQLENGERPILLIQAPPQHGKSVQITDFIAWMAGHNPDLRVIYASYSERLGVRANLALQRIYDSPKYQGVFPDTRISERNTVTISSQTLRNREILEYVGREGYFRNTTVRGAITGEGLDLGIIDDPIKNREEANSQTIRDKTWDWFTDDFESRFSDRAGVLGIMTRWHVDDPFGRMQKHNDRVQVLRYPAIAENDETHRKAGEPLFPEHKSLEFLLQRKSDMHAANFEALYQQNPIVLGGDIFRDGWWQYYRGDVEFEYRKIFADTAQKTGQQNDYSVFQLWGYKSGQAYLVDQMRGKYEAPELLKAARAFWNKHNSMNRIRSFEVEDKVSGTGLIQTLQRERIPVKGIQRGKDKVTRALDAAPMIETGNVFLPEGAPWLKDYISEFSAFPNGAHDDQVDPTMDAIADLRKGSQKPTPIRIRM